MKLAGILIMGLAMVFLAVGFIMLPISTEASQDLLDYQYSSNSSITDATYTGYTALIGITPLLILLGYLSAAVFSFYLGVQVSRGVGASSLNLGTLILLSLSIVFIAIGLIVEPVAVDGISGVLHNDGAGISSGFTGYSPLVLATPMLIHLGFIGGAILSGFFGLKRLGRGG